MNPHAVRSVSLLALLESFRDNWQLIVQLTRREVAGRYQGSVMGIAWSLFYPILMLAVYTFVFSVVFKARWGGAEEGGKMGFAAVLFAGMSVHGLFAEVLQRAPTLILANQNYVKKVVFPLEILPLTSLGAALFQHAINVGVLLVAVLFVRGAIPLSAWCFPLVILPLALMTLGLAWMLASLGVYLRDVGQTVGIVTMVTLFLSPVFYPITALPENLRFWMMLNPLTFIIEQARDVLIWGKYPNWPLLGAFTVAAFCWAWAGFAWFQKTRRGFADVL